MHEADRFMGDQRRLFGGLCDHRIAGRKPGRDLAKENCQREVPRRNADKDAPSAPAEPVFFTGRAGHRLHLREHVARAGGVIAQEVNRLADFGNAVIKCLAGFDRQQRHEPVAPVFEQIGRPVECSRAETRVCS
jgi:hypothetical protein